MTQNNLLAIVTMWDKINQLSRESLSQAQIAVALGVSRDTVRHYQRMSESEFRNHLVKEIQRHKRKLEAYDDFILGLLQDAQYLSAAQVHDRLKENYPDFPYVSERTVYNTVQRIRMRHNLPKRMECARAMSKVPDCEYGEKAQVDYGEKWLRTTAGRQIKVYFMVMVLQRSKYKYVYLQNVPFTAKTTVYAHHLAFKYFGGMPQKVIYDQDRKMLVNENYGDYIMTSHFAGFVAQAGYEPVFCMPFDPESKGLSESVVKYVKGNFLSGRTYINISSLNEECLGWLSRTANAKPHSSTGLVPSEEFKTEQPMLRPYTLNMEEPQLEAREYGVRKDNTLLYHSNFYSLPLGTYAGQGTKVLVVRNMDRNELDVYAPKDFSLITTHAISPLRGRYISKEGHACMKSRDILESEKILRTFFDEWDDESTLSRFFSLLKLDRPRYYGKTVKAMSSLLTDYDRPTALRLLQMFLERKVYNANDMADLARTNADRMEGQPKPVVGSSSSSCAPADMTPEKRPIKDYENVLGKNGKNE